MKVTKMKTAHTHANTAHVYSPQHARLTDHSGRDCATDGRNIK